MIEQAPLGLPGMPLDADSPVFSEPWEARAFAMVLALHQRGLLTWPQWAEALSRQIDRAQAAGDADLGDTYYQHWLQALESLVKDLPNSPNSPNSPNVPPLKVSQLP
jgi:nitrile hydratase accessory protein